MREKNVVEYLHYTGKKTCLQIELISNGDTPVAKPKIRNLRRPIERTSRQTPLFHCINHCYK